MIRNLKIKAYQVALVFKNRNLIEVLKEGNYWIFGNKSVEIYEMKNQFLATLWNAKGSHYFGKFYINNFLK